MSDHGGGRRRSSTNNSGRRKYTPRRKVCIFTAEGVVPDYKDLKRLQRMVSDRGKILPRRRTGTCAKYQRRLNVAIKRARHLALLPFVSENTRG